MAGFRASNLLNYNVVILKVDLGRRGCVWDFEANFRYGYMGVVSSIEKRESLLWRDAFAV
mgnify:CR=1 FL=1